MLPNTFFLTHLGYFSSLYGQTQHSFLFFFLLAYLKHFHVLHFSLSREPRNRNTEGTIQKILKNGNLSWKEYPYSPAPQMGCWHRFHWACFLWPHADNNLLQVCCVCGWEGGCLRWILQDWMPLGFLLSSFLFLWTWERILENCVPNVVKDRRGDGKKPQWHLESYHDHMFVTTILSAWAQFSRVKNRKSNWSRHCLSDLSSWCLRNPLPDKPQLFHNWS